LKAVVYRSFGGPEVLEYTDVPDPKLAQNSVLVRMRATALNPADHQLQAGLGENHTDAWITDVSMEVIWLVASFRAASALTPLVTCHRSRVRIMPTE
jgi:hypothetical protein